MASSAPTKVRPLSAGERCAEIIGIRIYGRVDARPHDWPALRREWSDIIDRQVQHEIDQGVRRELKRARFSASTASPSPSPVGRAFSPSPSDRSAT